MKKPLPMYRIELSRQAEKELKQLDKRTRKRLKQKLSWYLSHENPLVFADKLNDFFLGDYRYRIGDYRVIFAVEGNLISITGIGHRREVYRQ